MDKKYKNVINFLYFLYFLSIFSLKYIKIIINFLLIMSFKDLDIEMGNNIINSNDNTFSMSLLQESINNNNDNTFTMPLLDDSINTINETEEIAQTTINQLLNQRETLEQTLYGVNRTSDIRAKARILLRQIYWRNCKEKCWLSMIILLLLLIDILLAYRLFTNRGHL